MNVKQALEILKSNGITDSEQTLRRWLREGKIAATRSKNRKLGYEINEDDFQRFIDVRTGNRRILDELQNDNIDLMRKGSKLKKAYNEALKELNELQEKLRIEEESVTSLIDYWEVTVKPWEDILHSLNNLIELLQDLVKSKCLPLDVAVIIGNRLNHDQQEQLRGIVDQLTNKSAMDLREYLEDLIEFIQHGASLRSVTKLFDLLTSDKFNQELSEYEEPNIRKRYFLETVLASATNEEEVERLLNRSLFWNFLDSLSKE